MKGVANMYFTRFQVEPASLLVGPFPLDMLRYDHCYPADSDDVARIHRSVDRRPNEPETGRITLHQRHPSKVHQLTPGRWASFGWVVTVLETRKV
jgi:hypothetical protein